MELWFVSVTTYKPLLVGEVGVKKSEILRYVINGCSLTS